MDFSLDMESTWLGADVDKAEGLQERCCREGSAILAIGTAWLCSPVAPRAGWAQICGCSGWICTHVCIARAYRDMPFSGQDLGLAP